MQFREFDESETLVHTNLRASLGEESENVVENVEEEKYKVHSSKAAGPVNWTEGLEEVDSGSFEVLDGELFQHRSSSRKILQTTSKDYS